MSPVNECPPGGIQGGERQGPPGGIQGGKRQCPRCRTQLTESRIDEVTASFDILGCGSCGGRFFYAGQLHHVDDIIEPRLLEIRDIPAQSGQMKSLTCPICPPKTWMRKLEHERDRKVIMDVCPSCQGTWLDKGELEAIQREGLVVFLVNTIRWLRSL